MKAAASRILPFLPGALGVLSGAALLAGGRWALGAGALVFGGGALASSLFLLRRLSQASRRQSFLDEQLFQSQKLASLGELSAGVAHEINNPLAIISQETQWAAHLAGEADPATRAEALDSLREIARQVERCREITHKLLDFARTSEPLVQDVDVNRLLSDILRLVEREASRKGIAIERRLDAGVPVLRTDGPKLRQVVLNLMNNAMHAIEGRGAITVTSRRTPEGGVTFEVRDTGVGIPRENLPRIFDPFFTTKPPGKGTGLGLSVCHRIIGRLGGRIAVESAPGKGSAFAVTLPPAAPSHERKPS